MAKPSNYYVSFFVYDHLRVGLDEYEHDCFIARTHVVNVTNITELTKRAVEEIANGNKVIYIRDLDAWKIEYATKSDFQLLTLKTISEYKGGAK